MDGLKVKRIAWYAGVSMEDAARDIGPDRIRAHRRAFGSAAVERMLENRAASLEEERGDEPCEDCGQPMRLHGFEPRGPFWPNGVPKTSAGTVLCPDRTEGA